MKGKQLVEHTNDWSIDSKRSMVDRGYFEDGFIHLFSSKKRRSPLINLCYHVRAHVIDKVLKHFISHNKSFYQVISLGAGFDTTFFRLFSNEKNVKYCEIDLSTVVRKKIDILLNSEETKHLFNNFKTESEMEKAANYHFLSCDNYVLFSQNLDSIDQLDVRLKSFNIDYNIPTIILSEVAITYMEEQSCTRLCKFLGEQFKNGALLVYEQIKPEDGFGKFMMNHFIAIQSPLKSLTRYNEVKDNNFLFYVNNGWQDCNMHRVMDLYSALVLKDEFLSAIKIEPFDEWEEFHLTCLHYAMYLVSNGTMNNILKSYNVFKKSYDSLDLKLLNWSSLNLKQEVERFGHRIAVLNDHSLILIGGVGTDSNCHRKSSLLQKIDFISKEITDCETRFTELALTYMAVCSFKLDNVSYHFVHGGCKSPSREGDSNGFVLQYEPQSSFTLHSLSCSDNIVKPCHRWRHTAVSFGSEIFIFGGRTSSLEVLNDFWKLSMSKSHGNFCGNWSELERGPCARFSHSCLTTPEESLILFGGIDASAQPLNDIWKWNSSTGWLQIDANLSIPRYGHTSHLISNKLYVIGGITLHPSDPAVTVVDLHSNTSEHYSFPMKKTDDPVMLHNHQSILSRDGTHIIIIGGGGNCFSFGTSFNRKLISLPIEQFNLL